MQRYGAARAPDEVARMRRDDKAGFDLIGHVHSLSVLKLFRGDRVQGGA
jgi:hypothetical protein